MTDPLRYRFYIDVIDQRGDLDTRSEYAETPEIARAQAERRLVGYERIVRVHPDCDVVLFPDGKSAQQRFYDECEGDKAAALALSDRLQTLLRGSARRVPEAAE